MSCESCDTCMSCNGYCESSNGCLTSESYCSYSQLVSSWKGSFSWKDENNQVISIQRDTPFFSRKTWDSIIDYINNSRTRGIGQPSNFRNAVIPAPNEFKKTFMTAEEFNDVSNALFASEGNYIYGLEAGETARNVVQNEDIVYGSYFVELANLANRLMYHPS